jgi:C-terminal processing protease CtpA/Prc
MRAKGLITVRMPFHVDRFAPGSVAKDAGFEKGDVIVGLNDSSIIYFDAFKDALQAYKGQSVNVQVEREGQPMSITCGRARVWPVGHLSCWRYERVL